MSKSHVDLIIDWFKSRGGTATLREILNSGQPWSYEWRARATDLRKRGKYDLVLTRGAKPSDNAYSLIMREENGQMSLTA